MDSMESGFHEQFAERLCQALGPDESLYQLFRFLLEKIPADRICCASIDRRARLMRIMADYTPAREHGGWGARRISDIMDWDALTEGFEGWSGNTLLVNRLSDEKAICSTVESHFSTPYQALLSLLLHADRERDRLLCVNMFSLSPSPYTEEHRRLLASCRPMLEHLLGHYAGEGEESSVIHFTDDGVRHASPEALLRRCPGLKRVMRQVDIVAPRNSTVLIQGPSGSGKELVAETIHSLSPRAERPLIKVNCGAIPPTLLDSELFGHEKGAFTGAASAHAGYFEQARGGTLYLDEIGELELPVQVRLLRVLESREIRRVGGTRRIPVDVRIIAATHRNLEEMVRDGRFREYLWYRLCVYPLDIPALALRPGDIPVLASHFYTVYAREMEASSPPVLSSRFLLDLASRPWPGNVRQLRYVMERAMLESLAAGLPELHLAGRDVQVLPPPSSKRRSVPAADILDALSRAHGKIQGKEGAAALLGLSPSTLRSRMKALGLSRPLIRK